MNNNVLFLFDAGILLNADHPEFNSYNSVYDKHYGYYDECQSYIRNKEEAIKQANEYVTNGVDGTYAVVSYANHTCAPGNTAELEIKSETYLPSDVIYSVAKINGEIVKNFIEHT